MEVQAYKTHKVTTGENLYEILDKYLPRLQEKSIVCITSKIISLCFGDVIKDDGKILKSDLIKKEADYYIEENTKYGNNILTIKDDMLLFTAGIDQSNADGNFVLLPKRLQERTDAIWDHLRLKYSLKHVGVVVTDSRLIPLRTGVVGYGLSWCGFVGLNNYIGVKDIFGREILMTKVNMVEGLATAAVVMMGETYEQMPIAVIANVPSVKFQDRPPTKDELSEMRIPLDEDLYGNLIKAVSWIKGKKK